ncbi:hypothetical protein [Ensifer sp. Root127]|uniref:hypothetical protein n=1 Tax=Ensifer sp. Root127 TaxID=1736440 RepID=UPI00070E307D|nr:hypothetical protein [Ensifer sp. Root127]KQW82041.1 hypothetical protein ASD03_23265 [Ensifer sp. Root127]
MNFSQERVRSHNGWPEIKTFKAEVAYKGLLAKSNYLAPFEPIMISENVDPHYQRCVGHLLDALDVMPNRPDVAFDNLFRIIDFGGQQIIGPKKGVTGAVQKLPAKLMQIGGPDWEDTIDALISAMPLRLLEYLAKRILEPTAASSGLPNRARHSFGDTFYDAFMAKYAFDATGTRLSPVPTENVKNAAKLLKLYLSGKVGTRARSASNAGLDLTKPKNVPDLRRRTEVILSLLLYTVRNERAHGATISPFRTSKATVQRYESFYFIMLAGYIFALGILQTKYGGCEFSKIFEGCKANIALQRSFFSQR